MKRTIAIILAILTVALLLVPAMALAADKKPVSIAYASGLKKQVYAVGEKFDPSGAEFTVTWDDSTTSTIKHNAGGLEFRSEPFTMDEGSAGTGTVSFIYTYNGVKVSSTLTVTVYKLTGITIVAQPGKLTYNVGEKFNPNLMVVQANYSDSSKDRIVTNYKYRTTPFTEDDAALSPLSVEISYTEGGITVYESVAVVVKMNKPTSLTIEKKPDKRNYRCGETFDPTGMEVLITYTDGSTKVVTDYTHNAVSPFTQADIDAVSASGYKKEVTVVYSENGTAVMDTLEITLVEPKALAIVANPDKMTYKIGESFDPKGMIVEVAYSNGQTYETTGYTYSSVPFATAGTDLIFEIYYSDPGGKPISTSLKINVEATEAKSIHMDKGSMNLVAGDKQLLKATVYPTDADYTEITWASTDQNIADVDKNGLVYAVSPGNCIITAEITVGMKTYTAYCYVNVVAKVGLTGLKFSNGALELLLGDSTTLSLTKTPTNATISSLTWKTSDASVVSVTDTGKIKGLKTGEATITASADGKTATINVTVVSTLSRWGVVYNCSHRVNVRQKPSGTSKSVGYAPYGCKYKVLGESGGWYQIQFGTEKAYIWKNYLKLTGSSDKAYTVEETDATISAATTTTSSGSVTTATKVTIINCTRYVYIRKGPGTTYSKMGHAVLGATYSLKGASGDWYVVDVNGETGYIYKMFGSVS